MVCFNTLYPIIIVKSMVVICTTLNLLLVWFGVKIDPLVHKKANRSDSYQHTISNFIEAIAYRFMVLLVLPTSIE